MANKGLVNLLQQRYDKGVKVGWDAFALVSNIAGYNICEEVGIDEETYHAFFRRWEEECFRIFKEECHNNPESALLLYDKTDWLREKQGLETMDELIKQPTGLK